jgi:hypothetical protein
LATAPTTVRSPDVVALQRGLDALAGDVARIRQQLAALQAERDARLRRRLSPPDVRLLTRLLPPLSGAWGDEMFITQYVFDEPALARIVAEHSAKSLGKLFARAVDVPVGRYVIVACGQDNGSRRWQVHGVE